MKLQIFQPQIISLHLVANSFCVFANLRSSVFIRGRSQLQSLRLIRHSPATADGEKISPGVGAKKGTSHKTWYRAISKIEKLQTVLRQVDLRQHERKKTRKFLGFPEKFSGGMPASEGKTQATKDLATKMHRIHKNSPESIRGSFATFAHHGGYSPCLVAFASCSNPELKPLKPSNRFYRCFMQMRLICNPFQSRVPNVLNGFCVKLTGYTPGGVA